MERKNIKKCIKIFLLLSISFVLIWPAIHNGYPLVYSDSGTYIAAGFTKQVPVDRPIAYCLFVRHASLSYSLWFVLIAQALLVAFTIYMSVRNFSSKNAILLSTIAILILSFTTSLSNYTSQIMPDIFSAIVIIGIAIVASTDKMQIKEYILSAIIIFSAMSHLSNILVLFGISFISFLFVLFRLVEKNIFYRILVISLIPILGTLCVNRYYSGRFQVSRAGNVFILGRMIEMGVVKSFLADNCDDNRYIFCDCVDRIPDLAYQFIWNEDSPLYDEECTAKGWSTCWEEKNDNFGMLIKDIVHTSKYRNQLAVGYMKDFFRQNIDFNIGALVPQRENSPPQDWINFKFNAELNTYKNAKQYKTSLEFKTMSKIQLLMVIFSLIIIVISLVLYKKIRLSKEQLMFIIAIFTGILGNALTVVIFSTVLDRYQSRIIWIIPLIAILLVYQYKVSRIKNK